MEVVVVTLGCGLAAGILATAVAWRWPVAAAPKIAPHTVLDEAGRHPSVARALWSRIDATRVSGFTLGAVLFAIACGGVLFGLVAWMIRSDIGLARLDLTAARWGADHATAPSADVLRAISRLGGTIGAITVAVIVAVAVSRRLPPRAVIGFLAVVLIGNSVLVAVVKGIVDRVRPDIDRLTGFAGSSFPSGHAATSAATFAAAALLLGYGRSRHARSLLVGAAAVVAVSVSLTRVLLGVHWLTDVVAGLLLGWTWFAVVSIAFGGRLLRFGAPIEAAERVMSTPRT